ncbi:ankyrin repeat-containing [Anaeramoeba flamelloides]|uniref:Ankyrin repeat-containing n=1 Tax=Anaeramoeba flamelloides TaxID=1746091 RepID=A0ABQ8Z2N2_9EUKA|nr:ankyrin repeat-containing [Anaeramoeba flamelloides]
MQDELNVEQQTRLQHASTGEIIENFPIVLMNSKDTDELSPLHYICLRRNLELELLKHFLDYQADPNYEDLNGDTPLHYLCKTDQIPNRAPLIKLLIQHNASINRTNSYLETPLHLLCQNMKPNLESIRVLATSGAAFNLKDSLGGNTPLHLLCNKKEKKTKYCLPVIKYLLTENADVNTKNNQGNTILHLVLKQREIDKPLFQLIIKDENLEINSVNNLQETFLHCVCKKDDQQKNITYVIELLNKGCDPNLQDHHGLTALHLIGKKQNYQLNTRLFNLLFEKGSDPNICDHKGSNLLHYVIPKNGKIDNSLIANLIKRNVDCNKQDQNGKTPFYNYCRKDILDSKMIKLFLREGKVDLNLYTNERLSPLHMIIENSTNIKILQILIDNKYNNINNKKNNSVDLGIKDLRDRNLLHHACLKSQPNETLIEYLLGKGLDPNEQESKHGWACLHCLCKKCEAIDDLESIIEMLIDNDADISIKDNDGNYPFHLICGQEEFSDSLCELLINGIDINKPNNKGETPLHLFYTQPDRPREYLEWFKDMEADFTICRHSDERNALHLFCLNDPDEETFNYLINECECEIESKDKFNNNLLHLLCQSNTMALDVLENVIEDLDVNEHNVEGKTPLHILCANTPDFEFIDCLIKNEIDINIRDNGGDTALHELCKDKIEYILNKSTNKKDDLKYFDKFIPIEGFNLFFDNGVEINSKNKIGDTPLICLCKNRKLKIKTKFKIIKLFLKNDVDVTIQNNENSTALHELSKNQACLNLKIFQLFFDIPEIDLNLKDKNGNTILHLLCMQSLNDYPDLHQIFNHLTTLDCDLNIKNNNKKTPLLILFNSKHRHHEISFDLIKHGADPFIKDKHQRNLLHLMNISQPYYHAVHFLINKGINHKERDVFGNTPLHYLCMHEQIDFDIVSIFTEMGMNLNQNNLKGESPTTLLNGKSKNPQLAYKANRFLKTVKFEKKKQKMQKLIKLNTNLKPLPSLSGRIPKNVGGFLRPMKFQEIPLDQIKISPKPIYSGEKKYIYLADWFGQKVCATALKDSIFITKTEVEKFKKELSFVCSLHYPHTVRFFGAQLQDETRLTYISEYCENGDLSTYISKNNISLTNKIKIAAGIVKGIAYLHSKNTMHRKLKTSKIVLDKNLRPKITGYGFSRQMTDTFYSTVRKTIQTSHDPYQSPEMLSESDTYTFKTDIYSFGVILWELMNPEKLKITDPLIWGNKYWKGEIIKGNRPPLDNCHFQEMISKCWHQDPKQRPEIENILDHFIKLESQSENMN